MRSPHVNNPLTWAFIGGKMERGESVLKGVSRELREEMGFIPAYKKVIPIDIFKSTDNNFTFFSFAVLVDEEFIPKINNESVGWGWFEIDSLPKPLHPGARITLNNNNFKKIFNEIIKDNS